MPKNFGAAAPLKPNLKWRACVVRAMHLHKSQVRSYKITIKMVPFHKHCLEHEVAQRRIACASPSVCASERSFSRLKLVKTYLRNKMSQDRLQNLMLISNESDVAFQLDLDKISKKWAQIKKRRILL